jgi:hypothetical protein
MCYDILLKKTEGIQIETRGTRSLNSKSERSDSGAELEFRSWGAQIKKKKKNLGAKTITITKFMSKIKYYFLFLGFFFFFWVNPWPPKASGSSALDLT